MCGIVGKLSLNSMPVEEPLIRRMCASMAHRGPDDEGVYVRGPVGLGMRRLSIIDLAGGHQPISNEDGTIWIVFNGEIYNFQELRAELEGRGHRFATNSDTEAIVHLYEEMGEACVTRLNGMFAFAIWDTRHQRLVLARDRLGQKPLHYALTNDSLLFASELRSILEEPTFERRVNLLALHQYLKLWYVPNPLTMFEGIKKLPPAHVLVYENGQERLERYWDLDYAHKLSLSDGEWAEQVLAILEDAVRIRLISDVPLGAFLSGGIDSSLIVALMSKYSNQPVKTFSIGFDDDDYNELPYARQVAQYLNTEHEDAIVRPDAADVLPKLIWHYGEPFGDESCIPSYYVSQLTRQHVTVALSGDGGDESFGGYPRIPHHLAFSPANALRGLLVGEVKDVLKSQSPLTSALNPTRWRDFWQELSYRTKEIMDPMDRYTHNWIVWKNGARQPFTTMAQAAIAGQRVLSPFETVWQRTQSWDPMDRLFYLDMMTYLPDDLQVKMDIASMATSLEVRAPFLDYRLVELAASMPVRLKMDQARTKILLRQIAEPMLPPEIGARGKMGFSMPIHRWLAGDLKPMVEDLLLDTTARQRGFFQPNVVQNLISDHAAGTHDYSRNIWLMLGFELWARTFLDNVSISQPETV